MKIKPLVAIDVCAGAGGWACAAAGLPIVIVAAFDREEDCLATYKLNHPHVETVQCDVTTQDFSGWRGVDLILGGIPCETLSTIRNNTPRTRAEMASFKALLNRFLSLPREIEAPYYCFEEVVQVDNLLPRATPRFRLCSSAFSAQQRKRIYIGNIPPPEAPGNEELLRDHLRQGPHRISPRIFGKRSPSRTGKHSTTFQPFPPDRKSYTVINLSSKRDAEVATPHQRGWRQLEWQECATLQGFPRDYLFVGNPGRVSKMIAQAIQIDTGRAILKSLLNQL